MPKAAKNKPRLQPPCIKKGDNSYEINFYPDRAVPLGNFLDVIAGLTAAGMSALLSVHNSGPKHRFPVKMILLRLPLTLPKAKRRELYEIIEVIGEKCAAANASEKRRRL